jgi:hypothetical protein
VLLLNECLLLFNSLMTQSGNFWIHPHICICGTQVAHIQFNFDISQIFFNIDIHVTVMFSGPLYVMHSFHIKSNRVK